MATNNNSEMLTSLPAIAAAILKVGVLPAIAVFLVYMGARTLPELTKEVTLQRIATEKQVEATRQIQATQDEMLRMLRRICVVIAGQNKTESSQCFDK